MYPSKRSMAAAMAVLSALAIAAPITGASAATTPSPLPGWDVAFAAMPTSSLPVFPGAPSSLGGGAFYAYGGTSVTNVFNGATVVQVLNGPAFSSIGP
jgi:hypothetical protein